MTLPHIPRQIRLNHEDFTITPAHIQPVLDDQSYLISYREEMTLKSPKHNIGRD